MRARTVEIVRAQLSVDGGAPCYGYTACVDGHTLVTGQDGRLLHRNATLALQRAVDASRGCRPRFILFDPRPRRADLPSCAGTPV